MKTGIEFIGPNKKTDKLTLPGKYLKFVSIIFFDPYRAGMYFDCLNVSPIAKAGL
jgi:hypothetical protein